MLKSFDEIYCLLKRGKWENDKSCPDIDNLILLSEMYNVTLDELIKGIKTLKKKYILMKKMRILRKRTSLVLYWIWFTNYECVH